MAESISIALVNSDPADLHLARWAQVPRGEYIEAARFCIAHSVAYAGLALDTGAAARFEDAGRSCPELIAQATVIESLESTRFRLSGPADGGPEVRAAESVIDDPNQHDSCEPPLSDVTGSNTVLPDHTDAIHDQPPLYLMASDLTSADLDELRAAKEFAAKMELLARSQCVW
jgi:hypothetical protein